MKNKNETVETRKSDAISLIRLLSIFVFRSKNYTYMGLVTKKLQKQ
jgi:hypothetical protein